MIESCPKKRMLLGISFLGILTIFVLIVESHWTDSESLNKRRNFSIVERNSSCWEKNEFEVIKECEPCTDFEIASKSFGVCIHTGYKEVLKCSDGEVATRSCDKAAYYYEKAFWQFEAFMLLSSSISTFCVVARKRVLNRRMLQRVQRQLANSV